VGRPPSCSGQTGSQPLALSWLRQFWFALVRPS